MMLFVDDTRTRQDWKAEAEDLSQRAIGVDASTAWERVRSGEFSGTPFAAELSQLMFLAEGDG